MCCAKQTRLESNKTEEFKDSSTTIQHKIDSLQSEGNLPTLSLNALMQRFSDQIQLPFVYENGFSGSEERMVVVSEDSNHASWLTMKMSICRRRGQPFEYAQSPWEFLLPKAKRASSKSLIWVSINWMRGIVVDKTLHDVRQSTTCTQVLILF